MKVSKRLVFATLALPLMLGSMSSFAYGGKHNGCGKQIGVKHMMRSVDLSDAQKDQLKELSNNQHEQKMLNRTQNMGDKFNLHKEIQMLLLSTNYNENDVRALATKMSAKYVENQIANMNNQYQMLSILTPAQKEQVRTILNEMPACNKTRSNIDHH